MLRELGAGLIREYSCYEPGPDAWRARRRLAGDFGLQVACGETRAGDIVAAPGTVYADLSWRFDNDGLIEHGHEEILDPAAGALVPHTGTYVHDPLHRMTGEVWDATPAAYAYDAADNLTEMDGTDHCYGMSIGCTAGATASGPHQINSTTGGDRFVYDAAGNVTRWVNPAGTYDFVYNARNLPRAVATGGVTVARYVYDGMGARVKKVVNSVITHEPGDGYRVNDVAGAPWTQTRYGGIGIKVVTPGGVARQTFTLADATRSTILNIDQTGAVTQATAFDPYGLRRSTFAAGPFQSTWLFGDKELETGAFAAGLEVTDFGPRLYLANVGRWLGPDTRNTDGLNPYEYGKSAPETFYDPDGHAAGHHIVPQELWQPAKPNAYTFSVEATKALNWFKTGDLIGGHNFGNGHPAYSEAVRELLEDAFRTGKLPPPRPGRRHTSTNSWA